MKSLLMVFLLAGIYLIFSGCTYMQAETHPKISGNNTYQCLPCGRECDTVLYNQPGECTHCTMRLVKKSTVTFKNIAASEICNYIIQHPGVVLLDVRTKEEFEGKADPDFGTLKNAVNVPIQDLESKLSTLQSLKEKEIIVYCSHSHRSPQASYLLSQNGFTRITNMSGGISVIPDADCKK